VRLAREESLLTSIARHNRSTPPRETWPNVLGEVDRAYADAVREAV
jgi:hypothetical protein